MLKIRFKDGSQKSVDLGEPGKTIGQGSVNDIIIDREEVNGFHADLRVEGGTVTLTDVNTKTGTVLNGDLIEGPTVVRAGDTIGVGGIELEIFEEQVSIESKTLVLSGAALLEMGTGGWSIVADSGPEKGQIIAVKEKILIGRALECDLSILAPWVSRKHAELDLIGDDIWLKDLGSLQGTYVNGEKIHEVSLNDGDVLQFFKVRFIVSAPK